MTIGLSV